MNKAPVIIPARAGSKGIINKNIISFCGKPLLAWSIEQALGSKCVTNVYVSTNGDEIAEVARNYGADIIWRPAEISGDMADSESAILHAMQEIEKKEVFDNVVFLQATSPVRRRFDIDLAYERFVNEEYDSLFSIARMEDYCLWRRDDGELKSITFDYLNRGRRQEREPVFLENGSIYIFKRTLIEETHNRMGGKIGMYEMPFSCSYEIDSYDDIELCEYYMKKDILEESK